MLRCLWYRTARRWDKGVKEYSFLPQLGLFDVHLSSDEMGRAWSEPKRLIMPQKTLEFPGKGDYDYL